MAQVIVKKSPWVAFAEELPGLITQFKQMQMAQDQWEMEAEDRRAAATQEILLKEYYNKKAEVKQTEAMFNKYGNLSPSDVSKGGADLVNIINNQNNIDMDAITKNLNTLSNYQSDLQSSLGGLKDQAQTLKELQSDFAGANRVLEPHEYEAFQEHALKALEEGGLGWDTTAGADVEYFKTDPTARYTRALQITEKMKSDEDTGAKGNYAILQAMYTLGENEDTDDLAERLTYQDASGNEIEPSVEVVAAIQRMAMQPSYDDFISNLNAYPAEAGGDLIRAELMANPNTNMLYNNLNQNVEAIQTLDNELAGINELPSQTKLDQFTSDISGVTNKTALFGLYEQAVQGLNPEDHEQFFNAMEAELDTADLWPAYEEFKGFAGGAENLTEDELNRLKYEQDFGGFQEEVLGEDVVSQLSQVPQIDQEKIARMQNIQQSIQPRYDTPTESIDKSLQKLDRISRMTDLSSQAYEEYLKQIGE